MGKELKITRTFRHTYVVDSDDYDKVDPETHEKELDIETALDLLLVDSEENGDTIEVTCTVEG
jgi:hypothetical protein